MPAKLAPYIEPIVLADGNRPRQTCRHPIDLLLNINPPEPAFFQLILMIPEILKPLVPRAIDVAFIR